MLRCRRKSEEWSECCTYGGRVPSTVGSEDAVELSNEILKKEHGWYREQQSVNELIVVRKAIGIKIQKSVNLAIE